MKYEQTLFTAAEGVGPPDGPLRVTDLFSTFPQLARLVVSELDRQAWLDAYLLTAGMSQLIGDHLESDTLSLRRISAFLAKDGGAVGRAIAASTTAPGARAVARVRELGPAFRRLRRMRNTVDGALDILADLVVDAQLSAAAAPELDELKLLCEHVHGGGASRVSRALRNDPVRVPTCFRNFDQHPDDLRMLAGDFAASYPDRGPPLLVVGVRTSGSYLAPLYAAYLRVEGYADVTAMTMRPGRRPTGGDRALIRALAARGGMALLCDDPPVTGSSLVRVASELEHAGLPGQSIVLLLALFSVPAELPTVLAGYRSVLLPFDRWSIHRRLEADAVGRAVEEMREGGSEVLATEFVRRRLSPGGRGHLGAVFAVDARNARTGERGEEQISVEGVGLGYFGTHAMAVADPLSDFVPRVLGVRDGLLYRAWLPDGARVDLLPESDRGTIAARIAEYVAARGRLLALQDDVTLRQRGQNPAWEAASTLLSRLFGRTWPLARALVTNRVVKRVLRVEHAAVIDGRCELSNWFIGHRDGKLVKVDWEQGSGSNLDARCCDPVFDLASVTARTGDLGLARDLQVAYARLGAAPIDAERWLLYQLAWLSAGIDGRREADQDVLRGCSRALQSYYRSVYFDDLVIDESGPLCGIDIDGVLEGELLGFPALTPASATGLRALHAHGYQPMIVTGRSLRDVIERCEAYRLIGGVAEYGSVTYDARRKRVTVLTSDDEQRVLERLRVELDAEDGVTLDPDYTHAIRAFALGADGIRGALPHATIAEAMRRAGDDRATSVEGMRQTDFVAQTIDKGRGISALVRDLVPEAPAAGPMLAFAVGDTTADIPMLALAERPFAPGHAGAALGGRFPTTRARFQLGFAEAVGRLIGHAPGSCSQCRLVALSRERRMLLALLAVREKGMRGIPWRAAKLAGIR